MKYITTHATSHSHIRHNTHHITQPLFLSASVPVETHNNYVDVVEIHFNHRVILSVTQNLCLPLTAQNDMECAFEKGIPSGVDVLILTMVWLLMCSTKAKMATRTTSDIAIFERNDKMTNNNKIILRINNSIQTNHDGVLSRTLELRQKCVIQTEMSNFMRSEKRDKKF